MEKGTSVTPAERFLSRVEGVRQTGPGRWIFRVPTRKDKRASGSAREVDGGVLFALGVASIWGVFSGEVWRARCAARAA